MCVMRWNTLDSDNDGVITHHMNKTESETTSTLN